MEKKFVVLVWIMAFIVSLACIGGDMAYVSNNGTSEPPPPFVPIDEGVSLMRRQTEIAFASLAQEVAEPPGSPAETFREYITRTYSVETTNVGTCFCAVRAGEMVVSYFFEGDTLQMPNPGYNTISYKKVGENTYEHRYTQEISTGLEELMYKITIFDWGYKEEFYIDNSSKLCCVYDYLRLY